MDLSLVMALGAVFFFVVLFAYGVLYYGASFADSLGTGALALPTKRFAPRVLGRLASLGSSVQKGNLPFLHDWPDEINWRTSPLAMRCIRAGYRRYNTLLVVIGLKALSALLGMGIGLAIAVPLDWSVWGLLSITLGLGMGGVWLPDGILLMMVKKRQEVLLQHFPDALDLIRICLEAGLGLDAAIIRVGEEFRKICPPLRDELHVLSLELRAGASRTQSLRNFADRTGLPEVQTLVTLLVQADRFGTGIGEAVHVHSDQLRLNRKLAAEEKAAKVATKLLFPLIFCIFPALLLVLLGPAAISIYQNLIQRSIGQ
jgi:tight adherence protein C